MPTLHVVVPIYNENETLEACLARVVAVTLPDGWKMDLRLVDDHSEQRAYDVALAVVARMIDDGHRISLARHDVNRGKGAALQSAFDSILDAQTEGDDLVVVQDADLEYDPRDFTRLMAPITARRTRAVLGNRWAEPERLAGVKRRIHAWGNRMLTRLSNTVTGYRVNDMECCYKVMTIDVLRRLRPMLTEERFGIEPQIVAGLARLGETIEEVPISYDPRGIGDGKKIGWVDGVRAVYVIVRERLRGGTSPDQEPRPVSDQIVKESGLLAPRKVAIQLLGFAVGVALLVWCIRAAIRGGGWERLADADLRLVALMLGCTLVSQILNGAMFWIVGRSMKPLSFIDLQWLNMTCGMLNYAPVRLGALARIVYHIRVDRMSLLQVGGMFTFIAYTIALGIGSCLVATLARDRVDVWWIAIFLGQMILGGVITRVLVGNPLIVRHGRGTDRILADRTGVWITLVLRILDLGMFAARMAIALRILAIELPATHIVVLAVVALASSLIPFGRLGFREFCVAITAQRLSMLASDVETNMQQLALVESAGEALVLLPVGAIGLVVLRKRWRTADKSS